MDIEITPADPALLKALRLLALNAYRAWSHALCGSTGAPASARAYEFMAMKEPVIGALVLETSTIWKTDRGEGARAGAGAGDFAPGGDGALYRFLG